MEDTTTKPVAGSAPSKPNKSFLLFKTTLKPIIQTAISLIIDLTNSTICLGLKILILSVYCFMALDGFNLSNLGFRASFAKSAPVWNLKIKMAQIARKAGQKINLPVKVQSFHAGAETHVYANKTNIGMVTYGDRTDVRVLITLEYTKTTN